MGSGYRIVCRCPKCGRTTAYEGDKGWEAWVGRDGYISREAICMTCDRVMEIVAYEEEAGDCHP